VRSVWQRGCPVLLVMLATLLGGCSAVRFTYNNADLVARYKASEYVEFTSEQSEQFRARFAGFHQWHRSSELPAYVDLLRDAGARVGRGLRPDDVAWAVATARGQYRRLTAAAARDAGPLLVSLDAEQLQQVEKRFAENNRRFVRENLEGDPRRLHEKRSKQLEDQFREWTGRLTDQQRERIARFADEYGRIRAMRFEDRKHTQQAFLALLRSERDPVRMSQRVAALFSDPDEGRTREYREAMSQFESRFAALIVDIDRMLTPEQRARAIQKLQSYSADLAELHRPVAAGALSAVTAVTAALSSY
jgi:hypothetical protein